VYQSAVQNLIHENNFSKLANLINILSECVLEEELHVVMDADEWGFVDNDSPEPQDGQVMKGIMNSLKNILHDQIYNNRTLSSGAKLQLVQIFEKVLNHLSRTFSMSNMTENNSNQRNYHL
jgi:hypothetical protein